MQTVLYREAALGKVDAITSSVAYPGTKLKH
jgi:hypothetical protein